MFALLAVLVYVAAIGIPIALLYRYHSQRWFWHTAAIAAALAVGLVHTPPEWKGAALDLAFGFIFVVLTVWGIGGFLAMPHHHQREKHA